MKFKQIINNNNWLSAEIVLLNLYPDQKINISGYEEVFDKLRMLHPVETDISIVISHKKDDYDQSEYIDVSGYYNNPQEKNIEPNPSLALEFTSWDKWLGMDIDINTLNSFSELEIIAYCLYEMTFIGFEEETIKAELERIENIVEEIENMSEEEKREKLKSWDDIKKMWKDKGVEDFE